MKFNLRSNRQRSSNDELREKQHISQFILEIKKSGKKRKTLSETHNARSPVGDATVDKNSRVIVVIDGE